MMKATLKVLTVCAMAGASLLISTSAGAWWSNDHDDWDGPWGYPGYGGWGGYPGYYGGWGGYPGYHGGWGGYPGYGGWGGYPGYGGWGLGVPEVIYTQPQESSKSYTIK